MADAADPPPPRRHGTGVVVVAAVLALVVAVAGIGLVGWAFQRFFTDDMKSRPIEAPAVKPPPASATVPMPSYPPGLATYYRQSLDWKDCQQRQDLQCATLTVPLDYAHPQGRTIKLAVLRHLASDRAHRIGQLVVNPGGPGVPAQSYAAAGSLAFGLSIAKYYDIVGLDPRGVAASTPLTCLDTAGTDALLAADPSPDNPAEVAGLERQEKALAAGCKNADPQLAAHMSTAEAARDMDVLRGVLGEHQLDYFGASYGTYLGATYASLFPTHVRRMVLDGGIDPTLDEKGLSLGQARGFDTAMRAYVADCLKGSGCPLTGDVDSGIRQIKDLVDGADADPLPTGTDRKLDSALAQTGVFYPMYVKQLWPGLTLGLTDAIKKHDGKQLLNLADQLTERGSDGFDNNSNTAIYAVTCLDHPDSVTAAQVPSLYPQFDKASPSFGRSFAWTLTSCQDWPTKPAHPYVPGPAKGAAPIVVIGTTRDPATPYPWSVALAKKLSSGVLITRDGDGHTGFNRGNNCVDGAVEKYLLQGTPPGNDLRC